MAETAYIVLREKRIPDPDETNASIEAWELVATVKASSAAGAIRKAATPLLAATPPVYVAVPARSWKPVQVSAVQTTVLKLESPAA